mgnify:CR=1 FL=1|tara:strand:- start:32933 stop:34102 length:1170 start_codon:yes stop_codon:yes gene_type:complete
MLISGDPSSDKPSAGGPLSTKAPLAGAKKATTAQVSGRALQNATVKLADLAVFIQQLGVMLEASLPLLESLEALKDQTKDPVFGALIEKIRVDVAQGTTFSEALRKYPKAFPNLFISMIEAGEASGELSLLVKKVGEYFSATLKLNRKVKSAMVYPIVIIGMSGLLILLMIMFVVPIFEEMFSSFGSELPLPTQILLDLSKFLMSVPGGIFMLGVIFAVYFGMRYTKTKAGRGLYQSLLRKAPIAGNLSQKIAVSRFCRTYSILLRSGVSVLRCVDICNRASDNIFVEATCAKITKTINQGGQLSEALEGDPYFPSLVGHMVRAGEKVGNVEGMLTHASDFYDDEIDNTVSALTSLLEPIIIVVVGSIIGLIVIAMFLPIFQLSSVIQA